MEQNAELVPKLSKNCDECKLRKVRCIIAHTANSSACINCIKRNTRCNFSLNKRKVKRPPQGASFHFNGTSAAPNASSIAQLNSIGDRSTRHGEQLEESLEAPNYPNSTSQSKTLSQKYYIDLLLEDKQTSARGRNGDNILKAHDQYVGSSGLAFFSEKRIASINNRLGHTRLKDLIENLALWYKTRIKPQLSSAVMYGGPRTPVLVPVDVAKSYINAYFENVHPILPFLDREEFEKRAFSSELARTLEASPSFCALYYAVIALGCQYHLNEGSYEPGKGTAWRFYEIALSLFPQILFSEEKLVSVEAIIAMASFSFNIAGIQISNVLVTEVARMAHCLGYSKASVRGESAECRRAFWIVYAMEKVNAFFSGRSSILADDDIGTPIPDTPESVFGTFDWTRATLRWCRLLSRAYELLFNISATMKTVSQTHNAIDQVSCELEQWKTSIPKPFRPGSPFQPPHFPTRAATFAALRTHLHYYSTVIALARINLQVSAEGHPDRLAQCTEALMTSAHGIVELTRHIDLEAYAPAWVILVMPVCAAFILFDLVVHNPHHSETKRNLSLLGILSGYFYRLEYTSGGAVPCSPLVKLVQLARQYVEEVESGERTATAGAATMEEFPPIYTPASLQTLPLSASSPTGIAETSVGTSHVQTLYYPVDEVLFPLAGGFSEDSDLLQYFDSATLDFGYTFDTILPGSVNE